MKFGAIDIGSNAIRLLFVNVYETKTGPVFHKDELVRVPVRLGEESFSAGKFSEEKITLVVKTMIAMKHLIDIHNVLAFRACATSAMRDASNSAEVLQRVFDATGIVIEVISGDEEARTILQYPLQQSHIDAQGFYYYIDVGGGSTELAIIGKGKLIQNHSFNIGTLRLLNNQVTDADWKEMLKWIQNNRPQNVNLSAIGVGGNINKIMKMYGKPGKLFITQTILKRVLTYIEGLSMAERIRDLGLKPDRADVIVPALRIHINVLKWAGIEKIFVPKQGLSDGIITQLYQLHVAQKSKVHS